MKKIIVIFICVGIGTYIFSCKKSEPVTGNEKYETLIQYLEENKVEDAYLELVESLQPQEKMEEDTFDQKKEILQGEWVTKKKGLDTPMKIIFEEDGTCSYGDRTYTWDISEANIEKAIVEIKLDKKYIDTYILEFDREVEKYCIHKGSYNRYPYGLEWEPSEAPRYYKS